MIGAPGAGNPPGTASPAPAPPPEAAAILGPGLELTARYAGLLAGPGIDRGVLGPREASRLWDRHLLNCAVVAELLPGGAHVCDLGSGAGLPGIVLAIVRPDLRLTLMEPLLRRTRFLAEVVDTLALGNVDVRRARAEAVRGLHVDAVTARAVAPLDRLVAWSLPLLAPDGALLALKGASALAEIAAAEEALRRAGAVAVELHELGTGVLAEPTRVVRVRGGNRGTRRARRRRQSRPR